METFNIFKVLEKDDKELIHSSFIKFLMTEYKSFYGSLLNIEDTNFPTPELETSYAFQSERKRIDIEATSKDKQSIVIIENKFKSFPYQAQLNSYDLIYDHYHRDKQKFKFLFCFDKTLVSFKSNWKIFDYLDLLNFIKRDCLTNETDVKQIFIQQYYEFLNGYYKDYTLFKADSKNLFLNPDNNENKFWLRLFYSALYLQLIKHFDETGIKVRFDLNQGNTKVPLINIVPHHWNIENKELLIQFQGNDLKFYSHSNDRAFIEETVAIARENFDEPNIEFKQLTKRNAGTYFIFKTKLTHLIPEEENFTLDKIKQAVLNLYQDIDTMIILNYS